MRKLSSEQKILLDKYNVIDVEQLPPSTLKRLEQMNEYETLHHDANRYLSDNYFERIMK